MARSARQIMIIRARIAARDAAIAAEAAAEQRHQARIAARRGVFAARARAKKAA